jgi:hypothetical protein
MRLAYTRKIVRHSAVTNMKDMGRYEVLFRHVLIISPLVDKKKPLNEAQLFPLIVALSISSRSTIADKFAISKVSALSAYIIFSIHKVQHQ